jgi:hypothetical protein
MASAVADCYWRIGFATAGEEVFNQVGVVDSLFGLELGLRLGIAIAIDLGIGFALPARLTLSCSLCLLSRRPQRAWRPCDAGRLAPLPVAVECSLV